MDFRSVLIFFILVLCLTIRENDATNRYYNSYISYGSGDTMIQVFHQHGGTQLPNRKWNVECLNGEAMIGIQDWVDDFFRLQQVWCKFTFPYKPPTQGRYPYFGGCHVRNLTRDFFCLDPANITLTVNTFVTESFPHVLAIWANNLFFWIYRNPQDVYTPYKCCKTPPGYYIDYVSCYYVPTHDEYFEYYDSINQFIVYCAQGYIMTGVAKKPNPYTGEWFMDWIQCCRVGFGPPAAHRPPVTYSGSGVPSYQVPPGGLTTAHPAYQSQYRANNEEELEGDIGAQFSNLTTRQSKTEKPLRPEIEKFLLLARGIKPKNEQNIGALSSKNFEM